MSLCPEWPVSAVPGAPLGSRHGFAPFGACLASCYSSGMTKRATAEPVGIYLRADRDLHRRIEAARKAAERAEGGHLPIGTLVRRLVIEALDARSATATE